MTDRDDSQVVFSLAVASVFRCAADPFNSYLMAASPDFGTA
tara:strand:+ start:66700 stop:66822 length:123 start_codon:yes stop_codon:yes gene_type:complete